MRLPEPRTSSPRPFTCVHLLQLPRGHDGARYRHLSAALRGSARVRRGRRRLFCLRSGHNLPDTEYACTSVLSASAPVGLHKCFFFPSATATGVRLQYFAWCRVAVGSARELPLQQCTSRGRAVHAVCLLLALSLLSLLPTGL